jgi:photosynthetic reaction center cytochrome c subunit
MKRTAFVAVSLLVLVAVCAVPSMAQDGPQNLQVLPEGVDLRMVMGNIAMALGVECSFCHVDGDRASDDIDKKVIARGMMRMMGALNNDFLSNVPAREGRDGAARANCAMCHRGSSIPVVD